MLSKVLPRSKASGVPPMVFPSVERAAIAPHPRQTAEFSGRAHEKTPAIENPGENGGLREKLRQLEARVEAERRESFEAGKQQGIQQSRAEVEAIAARLNASIAEVLALRSDLRRRAERDTVQLALLIARRILHRELNVDEGALTALARVAFERLARSESYRVKVHPRFAAGVSAALPASQAARVQIEPDPDCAPGTLIFHAHEGTMDASIDTQLEEIRRGLTDRLAG